jgi:hypothetical protein
VLWVKGDGLGLAVAWARARPMVESAANFSRARRCIEIILCFSRRNIVRRYALETGVEQGFGIDGKVAHYCFGRPDNAAFDNAGGQGNLICRTNETYPLACTFQILHGIVMQELGYCQVLELS